MSDYRIGCFLVVACALLFAGCGEGSSSAPERAASERSFSVKTVKAFSLGGQSADAARTGINGDISDEVFEGQIAVLGLVPDTATPKFPIIMLPGFALGATIYIETPDGREGWAMNAVRRGHPVYLVEPAQSARAGFNPDPYTAAQLGEASESPLLFTWGRQHVWSRWGLGPEYPKPFADSRFPVEHYDNLIRAYTPINVGSIAGGSMITYQLEANVVGLTELLEQTGPAVLLVHSASGTTGFEVARRASGNVRAVVNVEPVGCPTEIIDSLNGIAVLSMFGDHMEVRPQMPIRRDQCQETVDYLSANGTPATMFNLPAMGIDGNSHLPMSEDNSAELMTMILDWLDESL